MGVVFVLQVRVREGEEARFLERYAALAARVGEGLDGHVSHRLCRGSDDPDQWLILSEWESADAARAWEASAEHGALTMPLRDCWGEAQRQAYRIEGEVRHPRLREGAAP